MHFEEATSTALTVAFLTNAERKRTSHLGFAQEGGTGVLWAEAAMMERNALEHPPAAMQECGGRARHKLGAEGRGEFDMEARVRPGRQMRWQQVQCARKRKMKHRNDHTYPKGVDALIAA